MSSRSIMGFDYGTKSIGVAIGQELTGSARPLRSLKANDGIPNWDEIEKLIKEWQPDLLIVGLPLNMDGSSGPRAQAARAFARNLAVLGLPILLWDERWSTAAAARDMLAQDMSRAKRAERIDAHAAAVILQGAIDALAGAAF